MESLGIAKPDLDVYLKARRDIGLAQRGIKGSDTQQATKVIEAVEQKYGGDIQLLVNKLYDYQNNILQIC